MEFANNLIQEQVRISKNHACRVQNFSKTFDSPCALSTLHIFYDSCPICLTILFVNGEGRLIDVSG